MALTASQISKRITWGILVLTILMNYVYALDMTLNQDEPPIEESENTKKRLDITGYSKYIVPVILIIFTLAISVGVFVLLVKDALRRVSTTTVTQSLT